MGEDVMPDSFGKVLLLQQLMRSLERAQLGTQSFYNIWPIRLCLITAINSERVAVQMGQGDEEFLFELRRLETLAETASLNLATAKDLLAALQRDINHLEDSLRKEAQDERES